MENRKAITWGLRRRYLVRIVYNYRLNMTLVCAQNANIPFNIYITIIGIVVVEIYVLIVGDVLWGTAHLLVDYIISGAILRVPTLEIDQGAFVTIRGRGHG